MPKFLPLFKNCTDLKLLLPQFWIHRTLAEHFHIHEHEHQPPFCQYSNHPAAFQINSLLLTCLHPGFSALPLTQYGIFWTAAGMKKQWKEGVLEWREHDRSTGIDSCSSTLWLHISLCFPLQGRKRRGKLLIYRTVDWCLLVGCKYM